MDRFTLFVLQGYKHTVVLRNRRYDLQSNNQLPDTLLSRPVIFSIEIFTGSIGAADEDYHRGDRECVSDYLL
jgi:hypothetical protein